MAQLLREAIGGTIRRARTERRRTLRDVSKDARVSLGYLSEIERGRKEPSSELLAAICDALALPLPDLLDDVADSMRPVREPAMARRRLVGVDPALLSAVEEALEGAGDDAAAPRPRRARAPHRRRGRGRRPRRGAHRSAGRRRARRTTPRSSSRRASCGWWSS